MADIEALNFKHRLFKDGQMLVTKTEMPVYRDVDCHAEYDPKDKDTSHPMYINQGQILIVLKEGTTKLAKGYEIGGGPAQRSIIVFFEDRGPKMRKILINPLYGPKEIGWLFTFGPEKTKP